ncbi:MAG: sel1 repeat family protein [Gammaproteobacteria bacterium]|nr:sel1 repeat family protein [Gammaproteobacteria bacterium]
MSHLALIHWGVLAVVLFKVLFTANVYAGFEEATEAYLLGDYEKARYEALVSAMDGLPEAQMLMGQLYLKGEGVKKNNALAIYWYEKAAQQGFSQAQFVIGTMYYEGRLTVKNYQKAWHWLREAQKIGHLKAQVLLDNLLQLDNGDVVNINESLAVLEEAAGRGEKKAQFLLAKKRLTGNGVKQDKAKAVQVITEIAQGGYIKAQKYLGEIYAIGDGVSQDYIEAYAWSLAYSGTKQIGGLTREGKQTARSALRKLDESKHNAAYLKSKQYFEQYVLPFHPNARPVGPSEYRIVVRSVRAKKAAVKKPGSKISSNKKAVNEALANGKSNGVDQIPGVNIGGNNARVASTGHSVKSTENAVTKSAPVASDKKNIKVDLAIASRNVNDVNFILEKNQSQIDLYFSQAQEEDRNLQGRIEFEMRIEASGDVSDIKIIFSELDSATLEQQLLDHLKSLTFGVQVVKPYTFTYPLKFSPRQF